MSTLFDESTLRRLEQLTLVAEQVRVGAMKGDRRSRKRGTSIEFADYRNYVRGDDLRRLDWNVYARLERPYIKLLEEEEDLAVHLLVDGSASMDWPQDRDHVENKLRYALTLAGALAHVSLTTGDQVTVTHLLSGGNRRWGPMRGNQHSLNLFHFLEQGNAAGITDINLALSQYALRGRRPGLLFLISDFLSPSGYEGGLNALQARGYEVGLIHLLSPDEIDPPPAGDLKLIDVETGQETEISLDPGTLDLYRRRLTEWRDGIANYCQSRGVHYLFTATDSDWERLVLQTMRRRGLIK